MNTPILTIDVIGAAKAQGDLQSIRNGLADRRGLHKLIARDALGLTQAYLASDRRHTSADKLGARPTGFRARAGKSIEAGSDADAAILRIPRRTGLGRAFHQVMLRPGSGKTYLTLPATAETYGKGVRDFPKDAFRFVLYKSKTAALVWKEAGGKHKKGDVAYWLKKQVFQNQDRTLLPSDAGYRELARQRVVVFVSSLYYWADAPNPKNRA
jgi:hypothetical protein